MSAASQRRVSVQRQFCAHERIAPLHTVPQQQALEPGERHRHRKALLRGSFMCGDDNAEQA
jgi:hypothetical protein